MNHSSIQSYSAKKQDISGRKCKCAVTGCKKESQRQNSLPMEVPEDSQTHAEPFDWHGDIA